MPDRCPEVNTVWELHCDRDAGHDGAHTQTTGQTVRGWGFDKVTRALRDVAAAAEGMTVPMHQEWQDTDALRAEVAALTERLAAETARADAAVAEREQLEREVAELRALFDLQWERTMEAVARWRAEDSDARALITPDLGVLLSWLIDERDAARADLAVARASIDRVLALHSPPPGWESEWTYPAEALARGWPPCAGCALEGIGQREIGHCPTRAAIRAQGIASSQEAEGAPGWPEENVAKKFASSPDRAPAVDGSGTPPPAAPSAPTLPEQLDAVHEAWVAAGRPPMGEQSEVALLGRQQTALLALATEAEAAGRDTLPLADVYQVLTTDPAEDPQPRTWALPAEPGPEVTAVRDADGDRWVRVGDGWGMQTGHPGPGGSTHVHVGRARTWLEVLVFAPLVDDSGGDR
jgi:hypothetical protein